MSSPGPATFKRPAMKKRPPPKPDAAPGEPAAAAAPPATAPGAHADGLLSSILAGVRKLDEACARAGVTGDPSIKPAEERAAEARKEFELQAEQLLRTHVVESTDDMASYDFVPTERPWRDVLHDVAAGLGLYSETVEEADGERHVCVSKKPLPGSRHEIEQLKLQSRALPTRPVARKQEALPPADAAASVVKLNVHKRDLRTIEEVQQALKSRKVEGKD